VLQEDLLDPILLNCQVPRERRAQMAANRTGIQRFHALCKKFGAATVADASDALLDYAERRMRVGITAIPDGIYHFEDQFDCHEFEGELTFRVAVEIRGDEITLDFTDNPPQVRVGINLVRTALLATVYYTVETVVDPGVPPNAGLHRPITVKS